MSIIPDHTSRDHAEFSPSSLIYEQIVRDEELFLSSIISSEDFANDQVEELNEIQVNVELDGTSTWGTCDRLTIY